MQIGHQGGQDRALMYRLAPQMPGKEAQDALPDQVVKPRQTQIAQMDIGQMRQGIHGR